MPGIDRESEVGTSSAKGKQAPSLKLSAVLTKIFNLCAAQTNGNGEARLSGPGLEGSRVGKETYFTIDGSLAGPGKIKICMMLPGFIAWIVNIICSSFSSCRIV